MKSLGEEAQEMLSIISIEFKGWKITERYLSLFKKEVQIW